MRGGSEWERKKRGEERRVRKIRDWEREGQGCRDGIEMRRERRMESSVAMSAVKKEIDVQEKDSFSSSKKKKEFFSFFPTKR